VHCATFFLANGGRPLWLLRRSAIAFGRGRVVVAKESCTISFSLASAYRRGEGSPPLRTTGLANLRCNGEVVECRRKTVDRVRTELCVHLVRNRGVELLVVVVQVAAELVWPRFHRGSDVAGSDVNVVVVQHVPKPA
jgi:hypothetical protein